MSELRFTDKKRAAQNTRRPEKSSTMNRLLKKFSYGLIQTDEQAQTCKLVVLAIGAAWFVGSLILSNDEPIKPPTEDLINA